MKMGVQYYTVAARLGDADAQADLGFCLANGKGCKKDRRAAARWYRAAVSVFRRVFSLDVKCTCHDIGWSL